MERLTKHSNDLIRNKAVNILRKLDSENGLDGDELALISSFCLIERVENKQLKKYEDLEEQGKLLKLPCAVGDTVYRLRIDNAAYMMNNEMMWGIIEDKFEIFHFDSIGKTVFPTIEEAEAALKEL